MKAPAAKLILSAVGVAFLLATPAEAAKRKPATRVASQVVAKDKWGAPIGPNSVVFSDVVIGADPDPNIRHQILRDLSGYFGGGYR